MEKMKRSSAGESGVCLAAAVFVQAESRGRRLINTEQVAIKRLHDGTGERRQGRPSNTRVDPDTRGANCHRFKGSFCVFAK